jgi:hypothetical protein
LRILRRKGSDVEWLIRDNQRPVGLHADDMELGLASGVYPTL